MLVGLIKKWGISIKVGNFEKGGVSIEKSWHFEKSGNIYRTVFLVIEDHRSSITKARLYKTYSNFFDTGVFFPKV
jgi:hypothetical protein